MKVKSLSPVRLLATPWTAAYQALPPMGFSRQEYWSGVPLPSPRHWEYEANNIFRVIVLTNLNNGPIAQKIWNFANLGILLKLLI